MTIREATRSDLERVLELSALFASTSIYAQFPTTREQLERLFDLCDERGVILVASRTTTVNVRSRRHNLNGFRTETEVVGLLALVLVPHLLTGIPYADELAWFVHPDARGGTAGPRLLEAAEAWSLQNRANLLRMVAPEGSSVGRYLQRVGYRPIETTYIKGLGHDGGIHDNGATAGRGTAARQEARREEEGGGLD